MATSRKLLFAFDFDQTLLHENTDLYVVKMAPEGLPDEVKALYTKKNWTRYMGEVFKYLHNLGYMPDDMNKFMSHMTFAPGMKELSQSLHSNNVDQIIISDSNSVFIDTIIKNHNLIPAFKKIFTNPAKFEENGLLTIDFFHHQNWCDMSTVNMCKGHILDEFIAEQKHLGTDYDQVVYVGDGGNDICPGMRLRENDILFCRRGYNLFKILQKPEMKSKVKAEVVNYDNGSEIWERVKDIMK